MEVSLFYPLLLMASTPSAAVIWWHTELGVGWGHTLLSCRNQSSSRSLLSSPLKLTAGANVPTRDSLHLAYSTMGQNLLSKLPDGFSYLELGRKAHSGDTEAATSKGRKVRGFESLLMALGREGKLWDSRVGTRSLSLT